MQRPGNESTNAERPVLKTILKLLLDPYPLRTITISLMRRLRLGSYPLRARIGAVPRPAYGYCVHHAAVLGRELGYHRISVLELGVGDGSGLADLEYHAEQASKSLGIEIDVYGFDTGEGLPEPIGYRDLPYYWQVGFYKMDVPKLRQKLKRATLVLGDMRDTARSFFRVHEPAPIGAVMFDLDFYSSTAAALQMFDADEKYRLPRVYCFFDDVIGSEVQLFNDYTGERLAINEYNQTHDYKKICVAYYLVCRKVVQSWYNGVFILHDFKHSRYSQFVGGKTQELPL